jgi:hypothetical protein
LDDYRNQDRHKQHGRQHFSQRKRGMGRDTPCAATRHSPFVTAVTS